MRVAAIFVALISVVVLAEPNAHDFAIVKGPVEFTMGSPESEPGRTPDEVQRRVRIPRSFARIHDRRQEFTSGSAIVEDREDSVLTVDDQHARMRRGGSFAYGAYTMRSAHRGDVTYFPQQRRDNVGFRAARTIR